MTWTAGSKVTAQSLNVQNEQVLFLLQELRTIELNPITFDLSIGAANGICPLDANGVVPLSHISSQLGGSGTLSVDLSNANVEDLKDVDINESTRAEGDVLTWDNTLQLWVNAQPFSKLFNLSAAETQSVLVWNGSGWDLRKLVFTDFSNLDVVEASLATSNILYYESSSETWKASGVVGTLTDNHVLTWDTTLGKWNAKVRPDITYEVFDMSTKKLEDLEDVFYESVTYEGDLIAWFGGTTNSWRGKSVDTWDLNNMWFGDDDITDPTEPGYSGGFQGAQLWKYYEKGWVPFWEFPLYQKDGDWHPTGRGAFNVGPIFSGGRYDDRTPHCDFENAANNDVIKWNPTDSHYVLKPLNLNHLGNVHARYVDYDNYPNGGGPTTPPNNGDVLKWDADKDVWRVQAATGTGGSVGAEYDSFYTTHQFDIDQNQSRMYSTGETFGGVWMDLHRFSHNKVHMRGWSLLCNGKALFRVRLFKTTFDDWSTGGGIGSWTDVTLNSGSNQNSTKYVLGAGQGNAAGTARKGVTVGDDWRLANDKPVGTDTANGGMSFDKDDLLVVELENFIHPDSGTNWNTNHLTLVIDWGIEVW